MELQVALVNDVVGRTAVIGHFQCDGVLVWKTLEPVDFVGVPAWDGSNAAGFRRRGVQTIVTNDQHVVHVELGAVIRGEAEVADVVTAAAGRNVDVALEHNAVPVLQRRNSGEATRAWLVKQVELGQVGLLHWRQ